MKADDTNIIVRLIARDDARQVRAAERVLADGPLFVSLLALLEAAWILESRFSMKREVLGSALRDFLVLDNIVVELDEWVVWSIGRMESGADFADMLLLVSSRQRQSFLTFDKRLPRQAGTGTPLKIEVLA